MRALEKRPENRYQTAAEFKKAILALEPALGLGLHEQLTTRSFDTYPLAPPTEKFQTSAPVPGTAPGVATTTVAGSCFSLAAGALCAAAGAAANAATVETTAAIAQSRFMDTSFQSDIGYSAA